MLFRHRGQPIGGQIDFFQHLVKGDFVEPFKGFGKGDVELVQVALIFDHGDPGEIVKAFGIIGDQIGLHRLKKAEIFPQRDGDRMGAEGFEKGNKHIRGSKQSAVDKKGDEETHHRKDHGMDHSVLQNIRRAALTFFGAEGTEKRPKNGTGKYDHLMSSAYDPPVMGYPFARQLGRGAPGSTMQGSTARDRGQGCDFV